MKMKTIYETFPISRIDEESREVEGYAFVNEIVPGEGGVRLKRSAMEAATADYLANGTSREMHQPSAVGKPMSVEWDKTGAKVRVKVVDDKAWEKVKAGVYKMFSVGVIPKVMRGKDVETANWWDTSLVDVGKDKDAKVSVWRGEGLDGEIEHEVEELDPIARSEEEIETEVEEIERAKWTAEKRAALPKSQFGWPEESKYPISDQDDVDSAAKLIGKAPESMRARIKKRIMSIAKRLKLKPPASWADENMARGEFLEDLNMVAKSNMKYAALDGLASKFYDIQNAEGADETDRGVMFDDLMEDFGDAMRPIICAGELPTSDIFADADDETARSLSPTLQRFFEMKTEKDTTISDLQKKVDDSATELTRVQKDGEDALQRAVKAEEDLAKLKEQPRSQRPVLISELVARSQGQGTEEVERSQELQRRLAELDAMPSTSDTKEAQVRISEIQSIKREMAHLNGEDRTIVGPV